MTTNTTTKKRTSNAPSKRASSVPSTTSLPNNPFIFEILELASKQKSNAKKVEVLRTYEHDSLKTIFIWNFDETVISMIPEGDVPYADVNDQTVYSGSLSENIKRESMGGESATGQDLDGRGKTSLRREYRNLYHYVKGGNGGLNNIRREMMFINLLRGLHPKEAEILILTKDKKLTDKYKVSFENVKEAYPDIQWGNRS